jgi:hypothetical protein
LFEVVIRCDGAVVASVGAATVVPPPGARITLESRSEGRRRVYRVLSPPLSDPDFWYEERGSYGENLFVENLVFVDVEVEPDP